MNNIIIRGKNFLLHYLASFLAKKNGAVIFYNTKQDSIVFDLIRKTKQETDMLLSNSEAYQVYTLAQKTAKIPGDIAEVGVYRGGSAKLIAEAKGNKNLYLFDTFEGLPAISKNDDPGHFHESQFPSSFEGVSSLLKKYPNVFLYKGIFPNTANVIQNKTFSFVNLDVDIYESTRACLNFFYPRMNKGAVILSHDYPKAIGVKKAFDEFFADKPEIIIEVASRQQCMVVKI